jgi:hypothetical protein
MEISPYTPGKLKIFDRLIKSAVHASARAVMNAQTQPRRRVPKTIYLFDIGSADGEGSTALLTKAAREAVARFPIDYRLFGFEKDRELAIVAQKLYADDSRVTICQGDVERTLDSILRQIPPAAYGIAVIDVWECPPWSIQEQLSARCRTIDHLVLCCAGGYKRHPSQDASWQQARIPRENLKRVNKEFTLIGKPWGPSQHVEMYFTNYEALARRRTSLGMVPLDSDVGQQRWEMLHTIQQPGVRRHEREQRNLARKLQMDIFSESNITGNPEHRNLSPGAT